MARATVPAAREENPHAGDFQREQRRGNLAAEDRRKARAHTAHDRQVLKLGPQLSPLAHQLGQGAPQLQGRPLPAGRSPKTVGEQGGREDHRGQQTGDRLLPPGSLDDKVGSPGRFDAAPAVHPHHQQAGQGQQEHRPSGALPQVVRRPQQTGEQATPDPHKQPHHQTKQQPPAVDAKALSAECHFRIHPPEEGPDRVAPGVALSFLLFHGSPRLSALCFPPIISHFPAFAMGTHGPWARDFLPFPGLPRPPGCQKASIYDKIIKTVRNLYFFEMR